MSHKFTIRTPRNDDLPAIRDLVTEVFLATEPTASHLNISVAGFHAIYDIFVKEVDLKTTVLAEEIKTGELAAVLVNVPYHSDSGETIKEGAAFLQFLHEFYAPLKERVLLPRGIPESRVLHCALGATKPKYEGSGIFTALLRETLRIAKRDPRYDIVMAEVTSPITRHIAKKVFRWKEEHAIPFKDYEVDGKRPFATLEGEAALVWTDLMSQKL
ncbi:hypothetical protein BJ165DRAFT_1517644 [Panaeolus papilionaceus]|nr:hypothetical protein BJ165DRAFT_1517644 [Panaeolus papilionaceus]